MVPIIETFVLTATDTDLLNGGRLNAIPYNGVLTIDVLADLSNATNHWDLTIQLPDGDVPIDGQQVLGSNPALDGVLDERQLQRYSYSARQGGHFTISLTETGTAICTVRCVLR